jgi:hypothetical protein
VLMENLKVQLVRPPITIRVSAAAARDRAFAFVWHVTSDRLRLPAVEWDKYGNAASWLATREL